MVMEKNSRWVRYRDQLSTKVNCLEKSGMKTPACVDYYPRSLLLPKVHEVASYIISDLTYRIQLRVFQNQEAISDAFIHRSILVHLSPSHSYRFWTTEVGIKGRNFDDNFEYLFRSPAWYIKQKSSLSELGILSGVSEGIRHVGRMLL